MIHLGVQIFNVQKLMIPFGCTCIECFKQVLLTRDSLHSVRCGSHFGLTFLTVTQLSQLCLGKQSLSLFFPLLTMQHIQGTLQMFAGIYRDSAGVFCNICRENLVIFTDFPCNIYRLQKLQRNSVNITGFSLQIFQKTPAESL